MIPAVVLLQAVGAMGAQFAEWPAAGGARAGEFRCAAGGALTRFRSDGFVATFAKGVVDARIAECVSFHFEGADANGALAGEEAAPGRRHFLRGADPRAWAPDLRAYRSLRARDARPGVDLVWYFGARGELEYDLRLAAGADPSAIVVRVDGAESLAIDEDGALRIATPLGAIRQTAPIATQDFGDGDPRRVACAFRFVDSQRYGFAVEGHDSARALRIDPGIVYATLFGGPFLEESGAIAVDSLGSAYIAGRTGGGLPTTPGAFDTTYGGGGLGDGFLAKFDPTASSLVYSTYVGGSGSEYVRAVSVDAAGCATVALTGGSPELPTTPGCYQSQLGGSYIAQFDATGSAILIATNFGNTSTTLADMAIDPQGIHCIGGWNIGGGLPATPGAFSTSNGGDYDGWAAKLNQTLTSLIFATYVGGSARDAASSLAVNRKGAIFLTGETSSPNFPIAGNPLQPSLKGGGDVFVTRISPSGSSLDYSTYLGGTSTGLASDRGSDIALDSSDCVHVIGSTASLDFPVTPGAIDMGPPPPGTGDAVFVAKLAKDMSKLVYSTRFVSKTAGKVFYARSISIDDQGNAVFCGGTLPPYLLTPDALVFAPGLYDGFVTVLSPFGLGLTFSTRWGGTKDDLFEIVTMDSKGNAYLLGKTFSRDFPTTPGAYDSTLADAAGDLTVVKMSVPNLPFGTTKYGFGQPGCTGPHTLRTEASVKAAVGKVTLECDHVPPNSIGLILVSDVRDPAGSDPLGLGIPFYVGLSPNLIGFNIASTSSDRALVTIQFPNYPGLAGTTYFAQAIWLWPQAMCTPSPFGLSSSSGLAMTVIH